MMNTVFEIIGVIVFGGLVAAGVSALPAGYQFPVIWMLASMIAASVVFD